ncbi:hypothetical protein DM02DRAFT_600726 [Periconia macrospinosa]|uniref:Zn(2)-C6 fungal-type domain-containing protein n=1 Tax=Periconia macrospinosa TaxID=97972 RepID=A0A2V1DBN5_9PLEO|nr:hypothetical protein DM02DRAFT_600726 [Periconia macrospinosa]
MSSYRGRPSKGCDPCRAKKVKCDEGKPNCIRCTKSGHECKYRDQADLLFRNQTAFAAQKAEESWRKRSRSHQRTSSESVASGRSTPPTRRSSSIHSSRNSPSRIVEESPVSLTSFNGLSSRNSPPRIVEESSVSLASFNGLSIAPMLYDLRRLAYERFIYDFVIPETPNLSKDEPSDAMWDFIPYLYEKAGPGSCLVATIDAVSYANFANRCNAPHAIPLAEECATKSIKLLQATVADTTLASSNETLCAVYLMAMLGMFLLNPQTTAGTFQAHNRGAKALIQLRSLEEFHADHHSSRLFELIVWQLLLGALHFGAMPPIPTAVILATQECSKPLFSSASAGLLLLLHRVAELHAKWHQTKHSSNPPMSRADLCEYLQTALQLDADLHLWETTVPRGWRSQMESNTAQARATYDPKWRELFLNSRGSPREIHTQGNLRRCWMWIFYRTTRTVVLRDLLEILNWMFKLPQFDDFGSSQQYSPSSQSSNLTSTSLDDASLQIQHSFATTNLVNMLEKNTANIFAVFNAPAYGKIDHDLIGIRGYMMIWPLGIMDAVLKHGFVPDSGVPVTPPHSNTSSPSIPDTMAPSFESLSLHPGNASISFQPCFTTPENSPTSFHDSPKTFSSTTQMNHSSPQSYSENPYPSLQTSKKHLYDTSPPHPFDYPTSLSSPQMSITKPARIDVAARREWLNCILYFVSTEFGIKPGIAVPASEGYLEVCKKKVAELISHQ